ncbi:MAG: tetratricopeptide repeat protein [Candidatus Acidiferrum sp.]
MLALGVIARRVGAQSGNPTGGNPPATTQKPDTPRIKATDSIVVGAHLTPDEIEDTKIYDAYQPTYHWKQSTDCPQIVKLCETQIIPMAEKSKSAETRNKFLFLANQSIAGCEMKSGEYQEAEQRYQKLFEYIPVWPGTTDSDYPQVYRSIGTALMMQNRWKEAETALEKSIEIFDEQIDRAAHSDSEFFRGEHRKNLMMSESQARNLLGAAYFRDGLQAEAMDMLEKAYQEAIQSSATPEMIQQIVESGRTASEIIGDQTAKTKWAERTTLPAKSRP